MGWGARGLPATPAGIRPLGARERAYRRDHGGCFGVRGHHLCPPRVRGAGAQVLLDPTGREDGALDRSSLKALYASSQAYGMARERLDKLRLEALGHPLG